MKFCFNAVNKGQFHQYLRANISREEFDTFFGEWHSASFGQILIENPSQQVYVEIERQFFSKRCAPATFRLAKKFGEIDPRKMINFLFARGKLDFNLHEKVIKVVSQ